ncbi:MAG: UbiA prenyltransferase family protein [Candidatus Thermoplasmatota archaeon]|nr:UbiA prenyltransferase family protein [Candidatus Thermoplasmatota archaeon]
MLAKVKHKKKKNYSYYRYWRNFSIFKLVSYALMFASAPMLAYGVQPYFLNQIKTIVFTILALYFGYFSALIFNDLTDVDIDLMVHQNRPLPLKIISKKKFFTISLICWFFTLFFSFLVCIWCFIFVLIMMFFILFHNLYFRRKIKIPAYSEIFTPVQWLIVPIFGFIAFSNPNYVILIILAGFTYLADDAHDIFEGMHDIDGDRKYGVKTYATSFGEKYALYIALIMLLFSGLFGILLFFLSELTFLFLLLFLIAFFYTFFKSYGLLKKKNFLDKRVTYNIGQLCFKYFLITYDFIFFDLLIQIILNNF